MDMANLKGVKKDAKTELAILKTNIDIAVCFNMFKKMGYTSDNIDDMRKQITENTPAIKEEYTRLKTEIQAAEYYERNPDEALKEMFRQKTGG